ncbi:hypothetical protein STAS_20764 [Striga asiatica]|uniref:RRM domain-containing protein n=1 Tax=Striga asiatica TaxID=4170 RepID=A0A5A7QF95_STRAF|nr:hypothetical protein STAS_20764 [Striga asiatica]
MEHIRNDLDDDGEATAAHAHGDPASAIQAAVTTVNLAPAHVPLEYPSSSQPIDPLDLAPLSELEWASLLHDAGLSTDPTTAAIQAVAADDRDPAAVAVNREDGEQNPSSVQFPQTQLPLSQGFQSCSTRPLSYSAVQQGGDATRHQTDPISRDTSEGPQFLGHDEGNQEASAADGDPTSAVAVNPEDGEQNLAVNPSSGGLGPISQLPSLSDLGWSTPNQSPEAQFLGDDGDPASANANQGVPIKNPVSGGFQNQDTAGISHQQSTTGVSHNQIPSTAGVSHHQIPSTAGVSAVGPTDKGKRPLISSESTSEGPRRRRTRRSSNPLSPTVNRPIASQPRQPTRPVGTSTGPSATLVHVVSGHSLTQPWSTQGVSQPSGPSPPRPPGPPPPRPNSSSTVPPQQGGAPGPPVLIVHLRKANRTCPDIGAVNTFFWAFGIISRIEFFRTSPETLYRTARVTYTSDESVRRALVSTDGYVMGYWISWHREIQPCPDCQQIL